MGGFIATAPGGWAATTIVVAASIAYSKSTQTIGANDAIGGLGGTVGKILLEFASVEPVPKSDDTRRRCRARQHGVHADGRNESSIFRAQVRRDFVGGPTGRNRLTTGSERFQKYSFSPACTWRG